MHVLVVGAHGKIGRRFIHAVDGSGHTARAMIRDSGQMEEMRAVGAADVVVADLEGDCSAALSGCDAVVFTAGSGGHTPPEKTEDVDRNGAISIIDQAVSAGVNRFVMVSSMNADTPEKGSQKMQHYFRAKGAADNHLRSTDLEYTIVRPGKLTEGDGTGHVDIAKDLGRYGEIPRDDVARVLLMTLDSPNTIGQHFEVLSGDTPIDKALLGV
ncbi:SDR family oxidoreductase [Salinisphaera sp. LB1]|uniref:SDR family oxidoreductase n=1 Tax=Salinisphaera sp. LB1 TaxID=2183911 RepID=UPI000D7087FB|nr:SDR family oxidoreductase [Salinisphaera sp. LB1]AWN16865.1 oxidoreductase ylbE [Salinisphaera sp. LB1]